MLPLIDVAEDGTEYSRLSELVADGGALAHELREHGWQNPWTAAAAEPASKGIKRKAAPGRGRGRGAKAGRGGRGGRGKK